MSAREPRAAPAPRRRRLKAARVALALGLAAVVLVAVASMACTRTASHHLLDTLMECVHRPDMAPYRPYAPSDAEGPPGYELLAGDFHCHVSPPDRPPHVTRGLAETVTLAHEEGLDFVVLTPHLRAPFFAGEAQRARALGSMAKLKEEVAKQPLGAMTFIVGFEYTDFTYGHVGAAFADLAEVLDAVPLEEARARPERFFEEYVARGGVLTVNHPLLVALDSVLSIARRDMSWKPFTDPGGAHPQEIIAADRLAQGLEVFNLPMVELRDRFLLFDPHATMQATFARLDQEIVARGRRMAPVGGSDSHSGHLRATAFLLSRGRDPASIREALLAGRVCVRDPSACSFEVRAPGGPWLGVGSSLKGVSSIRARARGVVVQFQAGGRLIEPDATNEIDIALEAGRCTVLRARVDEGYSAPIYANCPF